MADESLTQETDKPFQGLSILPSKPAPTKALPRVTADEDYDKIEPGRKFIAPDGSTREKPWLVTSDADYANVPEGARFLDPDGQLRQKPTFEGIDVTAQTLYDMAVTPSERRKALERSYPGKIKEDAEGLYIEDNGKLRRPGRGLSGVAGFVGSAAGPAIGSGLGALGLGIAAGPVGAAAGGGFGATAGQAFNDMVLQLAGVWDRSTGEELANLGKSTLMGAAGAGVGRGLGAVLPAARLGLSKVGAAAPAVAAHFLGAGGEDLKMARSLAEKGVQVPPSAWAHEAPHLQNLVEVFDPAFRTNKPLLQSATEHYERSAKQVLDDLGVKRDTSLAEPREAVSTQAAGERVLQRTLGESAAADQALRDAMTQRKAQLESGLPDTLAQREAITKAADDARKQAQKLIDAGFKDIEGDVDLAMKSAGAGANTGDLWEMIGNKLIAVRRGVSERANKMYGEADELAGPYIPNSEGLPQLAAEFRDQLPAEFKSKYPDVVRKLEDLAGVQDPKTGEWIKEPTQPTFGQLHNLRSLLRGNADWYTLSSDLKNGTYKYFSNRVDDILHDANAVPQLKDAARALDRADAFYRENIRIFDAQQIKAIVKGLEAGEPADPANLYRAVVKEGHSDLTRRVRDMVGPNLWAGVKAADTQAMLDASKGLAPGTIDGRKFVREVLERHRANMLDVVHGKDASEKLLAQARAIEQLDGRLPIPVKPDDTMTQVIARARLAADEAKAAGQKDPLGTLNREMKKIEAEQSRAQAALKRERRDDPLAFLYDPTTGATEAVNKILGNEDLVLAAAAKFGEKSPEFNMLRQVYVERLLQGTIDPAKRLEKVSPELQQLMFPGATLPQMQLLAKEMSFLLDTRALRHGDFAGGMSAMSKVEHPMGKVISKIPGINVASNAGARAALGKFYATITNLMTSPATLRWIEKGLTGGNKEEQEAIRAWLRQQANRSGALGAGAGEMLYQGSGDTP